MNIAYNLVHAVFAKVVSCILMVGVCLVDPSQNTRKQKEKQERDERYQRAKKIAKEYLEKLMEESEDESFDEIAEDVLDKTGQDLKRQKAPERR